MTAVCIFGGTAEGRELAEYCAQLQIPAIVSVVSEYGARMLPRAEGLDIRQGALDEDGIRALLALERPALVLDATHPYAQVVTAALVRVCRELELPYQRVRREQSHYDEAGQVVVVKDAAAAAAYLHDREGAVLVTTGSKELSLFTALNHDTERIFARVLPDSKVIGMCEEYGIRGSHLIGMQGPFSTELNIAILRQTGARWLVTKESGDSGGFEEKLAAARACGATVVVIGRPPEENGITLAEARQRLLPFSGRQSQKLSRQLYLIGMGMGGGRQLTVEAVAALKACQAVLGAGRMLEDVREWIAGKETAGIYLEQDILAWLDAHPQYRTVGIVYSGDTGFYSGSRSLLRTLAAGGSGIAGDQVTVFPGISTVSALCARLQTSWEDVCLASIHGRDEDVLALLAKHERVFLLLGGAHTLSGLCRRLVDGGYGEAWVRAGERLGYPEEIIRTGTARQLLDVESAALTAVLIENKKEKERDKNEG